MTDQQDRERESREQSTTKFEQATEREEQEREAAVEKVGEDLRPEADA